MAAGSAIIIRLSLHGGCVGNIQGLYLSLSEKSRSLSFTSRWSCLSEEGEEEVFGVEELPDVLVEELDRRHRVRVELRREEAQEPRQPCREGRQVSGPWPLWSKCGRYRGTSLIKNCLLPGPYSRTMPRALRWALGRGAVSHERGSLLQGRPSSTRPPAGTESGSSFDEKKRRNPPSPVQGYLAQKKQQPPPGPP